jgi:hypothetical protein
LGGDHFPGFDATIFIGIDAPAGAAPVHPAKLVGANVAAGFVVAVGVDFAVDFESESVVVVDVGWAVTVGIGESSERFVGGAVDDVAVLFLNEPAFGEVFGFGRVEFHAFLDGNVLFEQLFCGDLPLLCGGGLSGCQQKKRGEPEGAF